MKNILSIIYFAVFSLLLTACDKDKKDNNDKQPEYTKVSEGSIPGTALSYILYSAEKNLFTGYNKIYVKILQSSGEQVDNASIEFHPLMDMGSMEHSSPVVHPVFDPKENLYIGAVVFTMPSGSMGTWELKLNILQNGHHSDIIIPVTITDPQKSKLKSFVSKAGGEKFFVAIIQPEAPKVGINDLEIAIFKSASMHEFPADSSLKVFVTPEMPTMGHGSPNNSDPVHIKNGHYKGKVNFTMTGLWHLNMEFKSGNETANDDVFFEINF